MATTREKKTTADAAAEVLAVAASAAAHVAANQAERLDHDALIRLESQVTGFITQSARTATEAAVRSTRIEEKVTAGFERINGSLTKHAQSIHDLESRPLSPFTASQAALILDRTDKLWSAYSAGKVLLALFVVEQPVIVGIALAMLFRG